MDSKKQKLAIEYLLSSPDTFAICTPILQAEFFDPEYRETVRYLLEYYHKYKALPAVEQLDAQTGIQYKLHELQTHQKKACADDLEKFCQRRGLERAIIKSNQLIKEHKFGDVESLVREALTISLTKDLGISFFDNPAAQLANMKQNDSVITSGWPEVDELLDGGLKRKEMILLSGNSGTGKSVTMSNFAINFMEHKLVTLMISLELPTEMICKRFYSMFTGVSSAEILPRSKEIATKIENYSKDYGDLYIVRMPSGSTTNDFRAYLKEFELRYKVVPDALIVDYLDMMGSTDHVKAGDVFEKDKRTSEQLIDLINDYNMYLVTASQQNRAAVGVDSANLNHSHIAGGISKINATDIYISLIRTDQMRAAGEIGFHFLKTRSSDGVGKTVNLTWERNTLRIKSMRQKPKVLNLVNKPDDSQDNLLTFFKP